MRPAQRRRPIVLVHGAWHGAWCWAALQAALDDRGVPSHAVDLPGHGASTLPLGGLHDDARHVTDVLDRLALDDVVLVGHSYGGAVITHAASGRSDLAHLVHVAAFALDDGESVMSALRSFAPADVALAAAMRFHEDATSTLDPDLAADALYGSCTPQQADAALARLGPQSASSMSETVTGTPRADVASTYVRCLRDRAVAPSHQAVLAQRCDVRVDLDTDHSPFLSAPADLADLLTDLASRA